MSTGCLMTSENRVDSNNSKLQAILDQINLNSLKDFYSKEESLFRKRVDHLNIKFYLETEKYLKHKNKINEVNKVQNLQQLQDNLFIILFKQIQLYIKEVERLNKMIQNKYESEKQIENKLNEEISMLKSQLYNMMSKNLSSENCEDSCELESFELNQKSNKKRNFSDNNPVINPNNLGLDKKFININFNLHLKNSNHNSINLLSSHNNSQPINTISNISQNQKKENLHNLNKQSTMTTNSNPVKHAKNYLSVNIADSKKPNAKSNNNSSVIYIIKLNLR
jgi:hypothetical protein